MIKARSAAAAAAVTVLMLCSFASQARAADFSISVKPSEGVWGTNFEIRGFAPANSTVRLQRRLFGTSTFNNVGNAQTTGSGGFYRFFDKPSSSADYRALVTSDGSTSNATHVLVAVGVSISVGSSGSNAVFAGQVLPAHPRTRAVLQMYDGVNKVWNNVARGTLSSSSRYRISYRPPGTGRRLLRVAWPTQDNNHIWGLSAWVWVTWTPA